MGEEDEWVVTRREKVSGITFCECSLSRDEIINY